MLVLRYSRSNVWTSWAISTATNFWFSHVDILHPAGLLGANITPGIDLDGHPIKSGVAIRPLLYDQPTRELFVAYPALPNIAGDAEKELGQPFDWSYILGLLRPGKSRKWGETDGFACIELVEWLLRQHGASLLHPNYDPWRLTPAMGISSPYGRWEKSDVLYYPQRAGFWCSAAPIDW